MQIRSSGANLRLLVFQKRYEPWAGTGKLAAIVGHERDVKGQPFLGNEDARLQVLLPDQPAFDLAVNIFTYQPGATLPFVETHIMEHGLLMLKGQGVYRLDNDWHPVQAGRCDLDGAVLPAMVRGNGQEAGELYLLQGRESRPDVKEVSASADNSQ
jgi:(S)-ureidoglycine aminohydrolase